MPGREDQKCGDTVTSRTARGLRSVLMAYVHIYGLERRRALQILPMWLSFVDLEGELVLARTRVCAMM